MFHNNLLLTLSSAILISGSFFIFKRASKRQQSNEAIKKIDELKSNMQVIKKNADSKPLLSKKNIIKNLEIIEKITQISKSVWPCMCLKREYCDTPYIEMQRTIVQFNKGKAYWKGNSQPLYSCATYLYPDQSEVLSMHGTIAILETGEVLASPYVIKHCRLTHEKPVRFAGEYRARNGVIQYLNRRSGHYQTDERALEIAIKVFELQGLNIEKIKIDKEGNYR